MMLDDELAKFGDGKLQKVCAWVVHASQVIA
jgi:hypothetical protein